MKKPSVSALLPALFQLAAGAFSAAALADYPDRIVRIIVPGASGSPSDILARMSAEKLGKAWNQPVLIDNRPGNGVIATEAGAKAAPDGYTLLWVNGATTINASLVPRLPYDTLNDIIPITQINAAAFALIVGAGSRYSSLKDLVAAAKASPGRINYASSGVGSSLHLCAELMAFMTGTRMVHIPYKGAAQPYADILSGSIDFMFLGTTSVVAMVKSGKMRALAVTSRRRSPPLPDVPTLDESGLKGFNATAWNGITAPAKTPAAIIAKVHADTVAGMRAPDFMEFLTSTGSEAIGNTPEQFAAFFRGEVNQWASLIKAAGIKPE